MKKIAVILALLLVTFGASVKAEDEVKVPLSAVKTSCYGQIDISKAEFALSEIGKECVVEQWIKENDPKGDFSKQERKDENGEDETVIIKDNKIVYKGNFVLNKGEEKTFENKIITVEGDVVIKPNARLKLKNSSLKVRLEFKGQRSIRVLDKSSLELINSEVKPIGEELPAVQRYQVLRTSLMLGVYGGELRVKGSEISVRISSDHGAKINIENSKVGYIYWRATDRVKLVDSTLGSFVFDLRENTEPGTFALEGLKPNRSIDFELETAENGKLSLVNTSVRMGWQINLEFTPKDITVTNSNLQHIWLKLPPNDKQATINLDRGHLHNFNLARRITDLSLPFSLTLVDTKIDYFKIEPFGTNAVIEKTSAMIHPYEGSSLTLLKTNALNPFFIYGADELRIIDSKILGELRFLNKPEFQGGYEIAGINVGPGGKGNVIFDDATIEVDRIVVACDEYTVFGEVQIKRPSTLRSIQWTMGSIERTYSVLVLLQNGEPIPDASVSLQNEEGRTITKSRTNEEGEASFKIQFNEANYQNNWELVVKTEAGQEVREVDFLTSTPIVFELNG